MASLQAAISSSVAVAIDDLVSEVLETAGAISPPIDALDVARRLGVTIAFDGRQATRGRHKRLAGRPSIFLKPDDRQERLQWATAHELGEFLAWRIAEQAGEEDLADDARERIANAFAARLLLPAKWFVDDAREHACDLVALKAIYATASYELIAYRTLDLGQPAIVSVFDQGELVRRRWNGQGVVPRLHAVERACQHEANASGVLCERRESALEIRAWPIHEAGWKREIVRTAFIGDLDDGLQE